MLPSLLAADSLPPLWMSGGRMTVMLCGLAVCDALVVHEKHATSLCSACAGGEVPVVH